MVPMSAIVMTNAWSARPPATVMPLDSRIFSRKKVIEPIVAPCRSE